MSHMTAGAMPVTHDFCRRNQVADMPLASRCTMRIGGPATVVTVEDRRDLPELLALPHRWLGKGANLLIGDAPAAFMVAQLGTSFSQLDIGPIQGGQAVVRCGAGLDLAKLIGASTAAGLAGPEGLSGVPASVGGALRMNAGTATCWMLDWVARVEVVLPGESEPRWLERAELPAAYRECGLPPGSVFLGCEMVLHSDDPQRLKDTGRRLKQAKAASQPLAARSAGCIFKNPSPQDPAGKLIDQCGLKGMRVGGAEISQVHGNFITNVADAKAVDVVELIRRIRSTVWRERGIVMELEVQTWDIDPAVRAHPDTLGAP